MLVQNEIMRCRLIISITGDLWHSLRSFLIFPPQQPLQLVSFGFTRTSLRECASPFSLGQSYAETLNEWRRRFELHESQCLGRGPELLKILLYISYILLCFSQRSGRISLFFIGIWSYVACRHFDLKGVVLLITKVWEEINTSSPGLCVHSWLAGMRLYEQCAIWKLAQ